MIHYVKFYEKYVLYEKKKLKTRNHTQLMFLSLMHLNNEAMNKK